ncbi:hypothetical protein [Candidatus Magnetaquicoccus inordinatus]|uniref:hypothetical protein n=1 Tax=Candidatus Magnetaquicoccus inordinatus TaxID=2496818 RepID=UPI00102CF4D9|nr:hypothetical protein [Candidatus Magnetaquicoccus inordinatus]
MSKTFQEEQQLRLLGMYERTCGEMPPADLLDAESSRQLVRQLSKRYDKNRPLDGKKNKRH